MSETERNPTSETEPHDGIVERVSCPACGAPRGKGCWTPINGHDKGWTHDARVYADLGVRADA